LPYFEFGNEDRSDKLHKTQTTTHTHTYQEDGNRKALVWAFLNGGSTPLRLDEDAPVVAAMATEAIADAAETHRTPERWVSSIGVDKMLILSFVVRS
jgi:hypothetical protein